ncbi:hypothetical protein [Streptomyces qinglanensis]|uniref:Tetratricopeptide repeat-containing protein n=1 Tax=Streptomyces qinglanensis TaxID=943816 RepID=A0A1H9REL4_9ACTN|nr:hypothetical protein [Streptomyces qinglanensis]SER71230.1 hypothetical protein SAMN05421870_103494 [Streptomyces qinglanensis]
MTTSRTPAELRTDIRASGLAPHGPERVARAEELVAEAEAAAEAGTREGRAALGAALLHLAASRVFGTAARTTPDPVARALRLRDEDPQAFDSEDAFALLWSLRWAVADLAADPAVPVAEIEEWLTLLAREHDRAGLSRRAVHAREFLVAQRFGDRQRSARAYSAWLAAERDRSADCAGCELTWRGRAYAVRAEEAEDAAPGSGAAQDEAALRMWEPVLRGEYACPHRRPYLLAASLGPLLRLGRAAEARSRHLAGCLLVREAPTGRGALARHLEFCARTGNEPRGLEILAEQDGTRWEEQQDAPGHQAWMSAVALLMRRLGDLGHAALPVPGPPGRDWSAASLLEYAAAQALETAERFDRRAGTTGHRAAVRSRLAARPLVPHLPLGIGAVAFPALPAAPEPPGGPKTGPGRASEGGPEAGDGTRSESDAERGTWSEPDAERGTWSEPDAERGAEPRPQAGAESGDGSPDAHRLLAQARRLSAVGHPEAAARWTAAGDAVARTGARLDQVERAELLDHRSDAASRTDPAAGAAGFAEAASLFAGADLPGEALACRARAASAASRAPEGAAVPPESLDALCAEAEHLHAAGRIGTRHALAVLLARARLRAHDLGGAQEGAGNGGGTPFDAANPANRPSASGAEHPAGPARPDGAADPLGPRADALDAELADLVGLALPDCGEPAVRAGIAEATEIRGMLAARRGDAVRAGELLAESADLFHEAGRPWSATGPELALARLLMETGDHKRAAEVLRGSLQDRPGAAARTPDDLARLHLLHADVHAAQGLLAEEAESLRHAAHALAGSGSAAEATRAGLRLGGCLLVLEETDEAAAVLVEALGGLLEREDEPGIVQACVWLGQSCTRPEQLRAAARLLRRAAELPHRWRDRHGRAVVTHLAADTHRACGRHTAAGELYGRAEALWRELGDPHAVIRTLHARGWLAMEAGAPVEEALGFMAAAQEEIARILRSPEGPQDEEQRLRLRLEAGHTYRQTAELLVEPVPVPKPGEPGAPAVDCYARGIEYAERAVAAFHSCGEAGLHEATSAELRAAALEVDLGRYDQAVTRLTRVRAAYPAGRPDPHGTVAERVSEAGALELRIETALS